MSKVTISKSQSFLNSNLKNDTQKCNKIDSNIINTTLMSSHNYSYSNKNNFYYNMNQIQTFNKEKYKIRTELKKIKDMKKKRYGKKRIQSNKKNQQE